MNTISIYDKLSEAESKVAFYLRDKSLWWNYEQPVFVVDEMQRPRLWTPDFYLPELGIYIEVVGNPKLSDYNYRETIFKRNRIPIIFVYIQNKNWQNDLASDIRNVHQQRWELIKQAGLPVW